MKTSKPWPGAAILLVPVLLLAGCAQGPAAAAGAEAAAALTSRAGTITVSGSAVHYFSTAIVHSEQPTSTGSVLRSTDIIRLTGDLNGYVLYHPTTTIDSAAGTLVNTGAQVFSGTVAGSEPVILHDDDFRFQVDLASGATTGEVHFTRAGGAPRPGGWFECHLVVVGTGVTPAGDNLADYTGECTRRGRTG